MKGILGKGKGKAVKFEFQIVVHQLGPWPAGNKPIAIGWQRGSKRKGVTNPTLPSQNDGFQEYVFDSTFTIPVTLYKDGGAQGSVMHGPFHKKVIIFAILDIDSNGQVKASQGSLVINMADYAKGIEHSVNKAFNVAVGKAITAAVGEPKLTLTIRSRFKKQHKGGPGSVSGSEYSADTTGSAMTANIQSFMPRFVPGTTPGQQAPPDAAAPVGAGMTQEQLEELRGFEIPQNSSRHPQPSHSARARKSELLTAQQHGTPGGRKPGGDVPLSRDKLLATPTRTNTTEIHAVHAHAPSHTEHMQSKASENLPESPSKYDSDGFLRDSDDEGAAAPPKAVGASKQRSRLAPEPGGKQGPEQRQRGAPTGPTRGDAGTGNARGYRTSEERAKPVAAPALQLPPEVAAAAKDGGGEEESDGSSTERNKHMVQQWLLNQTDSFHSVEHPSLSDRRDSTKSGSGMGPSRHQDRPPMDRISEKRIPQISDFGADSPAPDRRKKANGVAQGYDADPRSEPRADPRATRGNRGRAEDEEGAYPGARGRENGSRDDGWQAGMAQMGMSEVYKQAFEADLPDASREAPARDPRSRDAREGRESRDARGAWAHPAVDDEVEPPSQQVEVDEQDDDDEMGGTRRRWQKKRSQGAGGTSAALPTPTPPSHAPNPAPSQELYVKTRDDDRGSRAGRSDRRSRAEDLLEQTKARYQKYLKDRNLEGKVGMPEDAEKGKPPPPPALNAQPHIPVPVPVPVPAPSPVVAPPTPPPAVVTPSPAVAAAAAAEVAAERARVAQVESELEALKRQLAEAEAKLAKEKETAAQVQAAQADMEEQLQGARMELLTSATLEYSLYMAKVARGLSGSSRHMHAPGRRLLRTIVALGEEKGGAFARQCVAMLQGVVQQAADEVAGTCYWWSNCVNLRAMVYRLSTPATSRSRLQSQVSMHWAAKELTQALLDMELDIFDKLVATAWWRTMVPIVTNPAEYQSQAQASPRSPMSVGSEPEHKAIELWLTALKAVEKLFPKATGPMGHVPTLKQQVMMACLRRVDCLLFYKILAQGRELEFDKSGYISNSVIRFLDATFDGRIASVPRLDDSAVMCERGPLTFQSGVTLKLAVTRWSEWAFEMDIKEYGAEGPGGGLFPLLRSTADVLMMPKELLLEQDYRHEICSCLPLPAVCRITERFRPDEFAPTPVNQSLLTRLNQDAATADLPLPKPHGGYVSPPEARILEEVDEYNEPGVDLDYQSDEELGQLVGNAKPMAGATAKRFQVLAELWRNNFGKKSATYY